MTQPLAVFQDLFMENNTHERCHLMLFTDRLDREKAILSYLPSKPFFFVLKG